MKLFATLLGLFFTLMSFATLQADVYTWTDENGVKHYSNEPPDKDDAQVEFKEYQENQTAVQQNRQPSDSQQQEMDKLIREIEADHRKEEAERRRKAEEAKKNQAPTREQHIAAEEQRLSDKIAELEEAPLDQFGSFKNKRNRIGYYKYRLQALREDPDKYFNEPTSFEGNVKEPAGSDASN
jgi:chromosome segregation ATPase